MCPYHINDLEFANALVDSFLEICKTSEAPSGHQAIGEPKKDVQIDNCASTMTGFGTVSYSLNDFPEAKLGYNILLFFCIDDQQLNFLCLWG